jgi:bifunctional UDP-N-acetylglucosamine pyrophosphorylase/glucosamine-1-phosphate N-acetyltransferase
MPKPSSKSRAKRREQVSDKNPAIAIAIMAAGKGTRLKSKHPKVLHEVGGKPLLAHVIAAAIRVVSPENIHVIIGHEARRRARRV